MDYETGDVVVVIDATSPHFGKQASVSVIRPDTVKVYLPDDGVSVELPHSAIRPLMTAREQAECLAEVERLRAEMVKLKARVEYLQEQKNALSDALAFYCDAENFINIYGRVIPGACDTAEDTLNGISRQDSEDALTNAPDQEQGA